MDSIPPPTPSGYQPTPGEGITSITVTARPSREFQTAEATVTYSFPTPQAPADVQQVMSDLQVDVDRAANGALEVLIGAKTGPATANAASIRTEAPTPAPTHAPGTLPWMEATKPNGHGTFRFLPSSYLGLDDFKRIATNLAHDAGLPEGEFVVWDDRTGNRGLESGNQGYSTGKIKALDGTSLHVAASGRIVANVDFHQADGSLKVFLTRDGKTAVAALALASSVNAQAAPAGGPVPF